MKYWEIIADRLGKAGWTWGCSSHIDSISRVLFTADAHGDNGKRLIVSADEEVTAFPELGPRHEFTSARRDDQLTTRLRY
jgi:hypothetical protein